jgi:putative transposase
MGLKPQSGGHSIHALAIHLVWCVKYRHTLLTHEIGVEIIEAETDVDHVHVVVRLKPTHTLSKVVHRFKGASARRIFQEYPQLRNRLWGGHLWSPSYYAASVGGAPLETIKKYVRSQRDTDES